MKRIATTPRLAICALLFAAPLQAGETCGPVVISTVPVVAVSDCEKTEDPIEFATRLLKVLGEERLAKVKARDRLTQDARCVEEKLVSTAAEHARLTGDLEILRCHIQKNCYPFCVSGIQVCNRSTAERLVGTFLLRQETLAAAIAQFESELAEGQRETDQIIAAIDRLECETVLVPIRTSRILITGLPNESARMLASLKAMLPQESPEIAAHRLKVATFLALPPEPGTQSAESNAAEGVSVK